MTTTTKGRYRQVLLAHDGSDRATDAAEAAARLAARLGAELRSVSVAETADEAEDLREAAARAIGVEPDDERVTVVVADDVPSAILAEATPVGEVLLVVATRGRGRVAGSVLGSTARTLITDGGVPLVTVGPAYEGGHDPARVVAAVDGSPASEQVLPIAAAWADALELPLRIVTVAEPVPPPLRPGGRWHRHHGPDVDADDYVDGLVARWRGAVASDVDGEVIDDPVSAASGLASYLERHPADLLVVGPRARTGVRRLLQGARAATIVRESAAPVVVAGLAA